METKFWMQYALFAGMTAVSGCTEFDALPESGSVVIGSQEWMVVNLDTDTFRNGDLIPHAPTAAAWAAASDNQQPAWCYYKNDAENGDLFGRLYNYHAVADPRGLAPMGWHIPGNAEWEQLVNQLSGDHGISASLKSDRLWVSFENNERGNNRSGFTALPGSIRMKNGQYYPYVNEGTGYVAYFWSLTQQSDTGAYARRLAFNENWFPAVPLAHGAGASVRCLKGDKAGDVIVLIGFQEWMDRNLDVDTFRNGDIIPQARTEAEWNKASADKTPAWCYYHNDPASGTHYGRLYNWYAATDTRGLAPAGWEIPDGDDWQALGDFLAGNYLDGGALKAINGWNPPNTGATNSTLFTALPGQMRFESGSFYEGAQLALFWSTAGANNQDAYAYGVHGDISNFSMFIHKKGAGLSVRCIKR